MPVKGSFKGSFGHAFGRLGANIVGRGGIACGDSNSFYYIASDVPHHVAAAGFLEFSACEIMVNMFVNFLSTEADWGIIFVVDSNAEPVFEGGSEVFVVESVFWDWRVEWRQGFGTCVGVGGRVGRGGCRVGIC